MSLVFSGPLRANRPRRNAVLVATGNSFSTAIDGYGRVWGWGFNSVGQLGNNTTATATISPVTVAGAPKTFCKIDSGSGATLAVDKYGQVWSWGNGAFGQLGLNSTLFGGASSARTPVSIRGNKKTFCEIANSLGNHSIGIDKYGQIWAWGDGSNGRLGTNSTVSRLTPVSILGGKKTFCKVDAGNAWTAAIDKYGQVWCWGNGGDGRLGRNSTASFLTPVSIAGQKKTFCHISAGNATTAGIDKYGIIWSWGFNGSGQLGNAANVSVLTPVSLAGARKTFCKINLGNGQTIAIDQYGLAWGWGFNTFGLLGNDKNFAFNTPVKVCCDITFCEISAGSQHSLAVDKNKRVWGWGPYNNGQLGENGDMGMSLTPVSIYKNRTFCQIGFTALACGLAIDPQGLVWGWGDDTSSRLGDNSTINKMTPVSIGGARKTFCIINSGSTRGLGIDKYGQAWCWGRDTDGNTLGATAVNGSAVTPVSISGAKKTFCKVAAGGGVHTILIDSYGQVWGGGRDVVGQVGSGSTAFTRALVSLGGAKKTFCKVAASTGNFGVSGGIDWKGQVWTWGYNVNRALGDGSTLTSKTTPVSIIGAKKTFCDLAVSTNAGAAIDKYGQIWQWGTNTNGYLLGINNSACTLATTPISIAGAKKTFCSIANIGVSNFLAIDRYGKLWGWGLNNPQLGDGTTIDRCTPVAIAPNRTFCKVAHGLFALDNYNRGWTWGLKNSGVLGNNTNTFKAAPIQVCII